jgi:peptidoglycan/LPS O-acetylase OafA/YrhL
MDPSQIVRPKMPELDSLRGIAILSVFIYHALYLSYGNYHFERPAELLIQATRFGWLGVNLFFVLSGFLITGILLDSKSNRHYFKRFYVRRALRILPIFYLILFLLAWMPSQSRAFLWMSFFYLSNIAPLFGIPMAYPILWSLSVGEHFYFFWPLFVRRISSQGVFWVATAISVIVPILRAFHFTPVSFEGLNYLTWLVADGLAMGAILAVYVRQPQCTRQSLARVSIGAMALAALILAAGHISGSCLESSCSAHLCYLLPRISSLRV